MEIIKSAFYGIVQGLTEFLPVSSSGHLAILRNIFGMEFDDKLLFVLILHLGSLVAVFMIYIKDIKELVINFFTLIKKVFTGQFRYNRLTPGERFVILILIATVPLVVGALIDKNIEVVSGYTKLIGLFLIVNAVILYFSDMLQAGDLTEKTATPQNALFVGVSQLIAIAPGISRMGATVTGGLLSGFSRQFAVKFSFMMSIPAILGASIFKFADFAKSGAEVTGTMIVSSIVGFIFAFVTGIFAIVALNIIARKKNFVVFAVYCFIIGVLAMIFG